MCFISIITWIRNRSRKNSLSVKVNKIGKAEYISILPISAAMTVGFYFMLVAIKTNQPIIGAISITLSISSEYLTIRRSPYYAVGFILNDIMGFILWCFTFQGAGLEFLPTILSYLIYLSNDIYGLVNWNKLRKAQMLEDEELAGENDTGEAKENLTDQVK